MRASLGKLRSLANAVLFATVLASGGCSGGSKSEPPPATPTAGATADDEFATALREHHRFHHHGGVTLFIAMSLETLAVPTEKRAAVDQIHGELIASMEPARVAEQTLLTALADGVTSGNIDGAAIDADIQRVTSAARTVHDTCAGALNRLHALLSPSERAALVDKVEANWAVFRRVNTTGTADESVEEQHELGNLTAELNLTPEQMQRVDAALCSATAAVPPLDSREIDAELSAFGDAFRSDTFDAKGLGAADDANAHMAGWAAAHLAHVVEAVSPVLTADQRTAFAERLRLHAKHGPIAEASP
ncbi:MAG TPA: hypothetical protein VHC69_20900 [Polyangiaceae bacterium]|nr:hypothetical protein [Polyangiaceae bacterium]